MSYLNVCMKKHYDFDDNNLAYDNNPAYDNDRCIIYIGPHLAYH